MYEIQCIIDLSLAAFVWLCMPGHFSVQSLLASVAVLLLVAWINYSYDILLQPSCISINSLIDCFMRLSGYTPHYASCPSFVCLSVCPVRTFNRKQKAQKTEIGVTFCGAEVTQFMKLRSPDVKNYSRKWRILGARVGLLFTCCEWRYRRIASCPVGWGATNGSSADYKL